MGVSTRAPGGAARRPLAALAAPWRVGRRAWRGAPTGAESPPYPSEPPLSARAGVWPCASFGRAAAKKAARRRALALGRRAAVAPLACRWLA